MSIQIIFEPNAQNELDKLPQDIIQRIIDKLEQVKNNPNHFIKKLTDMEESKIRVGDYRLIVIYDKFEKKVKILAIGLRKNIYKRYKIK